MIFIIEDENHAEMCGEFSSFDEALTELRSRAAISWDSEPNACPCASRNTCERDYSIVEYDNAQMPWKEVKRISVLKVSIKGSFWSKEFGQYG
jgi:hypothetical protein